MNVLITGSDGFIARNLISHLDQDPKYIIYPFSRKNNISDLKAIISKVDFVIHLAGVNRPENINVFLKDNLELTRSLCNELKLSKRDIPIIFSSSIQAETGNPYGKSKLESENIISSYSKRTGNSVFIYRLPNIFGKWSKPNYNSAVATFCFNVVNDIDIEIHDSKAEVELVYIDDLVTEFLSVLSKEKKSIKSPSYPIYKIEVGNLAKIIKAFKASRENLVMENVGRGLKRALYATFLSFYEPSSFSYKLKMHQDERGNFSEFLKNRDAGQLSFFTINPGSTRGQHYHHTKNEKFLVVKGSAKFRFRNILNNEVFSMEVNDKDPEVVETIPGWVHDITNSGKDKTVVMLWANEIFNQELPDTYVSDIEI